jgi:hypothetical protein
MTCVMFEGIVMHNALNYLAAIAACTLLAASASAQSAADIRDRAQVYDNFFSPPGCLRIILTLRPPLSSPRQEPSKP